MSVPSGLPVLFICSVAALASNTTLPTEPPRSPSFVYNSSPVKWETALESCGNQTLHLPMFRNAQAADISGLKKYVHMTPGRDVWTGDYKTFEVVPKSTNKPGSESGLMCVSATLADMRALKNALRFEFNFTLTDCSERNKYICTCHSATNTTTINIDKSASAVWQNAVGSCHVLGNHCTLWTPDLTLYKTTVDDTIGLGKFLLRRNDFNLNLRDKFWSGIRIKTTNGSGQGNILLCGYITYNETRLRYGACDQLKGFVCENGSGSIKDMRSDNIKPTESEASGSASGWVYAVVVIIVLIAVGAGAATILIYRKRKRDESDTMKLSQGSVISRPQGGRSFTRNPDIGESTHAEPKIPDPKRITTYAQINPGDLEVEKSKTRKIPPYTSVPFSKPVNTPDIVQTTDSAGYLPMDGRVPDPDEANIEHEGSYNTLCHSIRENTGSFEESTNVYGAPSGGVDFSTYDFADPVENSNHMDDYDDVMVSRTDPMHNRMCNSEELVRRNTVNMSSHNPVYEDMQI